MTLPQRSTFVSVIAWVFIVFSSLGVLVMLLETALFFLMPFEELMQHDMQANQAPFPSGVFIGIMRGFVLAMLLVCIWSLISSIGLLLRKNWGRINFIVIMAIGVFFQALGIIWTIVMMFGFNFFADGMQAETEADFLQVFMWVIFGFGLLFNAGFIVLYSWIIKKLVSPVIKKEFNPPATTEPATMT